MKKSVIILILIIYLASIFVVGFLGTKIGSYDEVIYATKIEVINKELITTPSGQKYINIEFVPYESEQDNINYVALDWKVVPENATNVGVSFSYSANITHASVSPLGVVVFTRKGTITVYIKAEDGSNIQTSILVRAV
jgi:hypothetical protein